MALTITNTTASSLSLIPADNPVTLTGTNSFTNNATVSVSGTPAVTTGFGSYFVTPKRPTVSKKGARGGTAVPALSG